MSELTEFLLREIAADEEAARAATPGPWFARGQGDVARDATDMTIAKCGVTHGALEDAAHIARHDPARVLAEVNAKRAILDKYERASMAFEQSVNPATSAAVMALAEVVDALAQPFAGRPGWRDEWGTNGHKEAQG